MRFNQHLFISYSHIDDQPLAPAEQGWVSRLHQSLGAILSMRLGRPALIWRDSKLAGNDVFADEIVAQFPSTAVLLAVLSPRYVESEWCTREAGEFCRQAEQTVGLLVGNKARVFKVIKTPVDSQAPLPPVMRDTLGVDFYVLDEHAAPLELDPAYGAEMLPKYNVKVAGLAWEIAQLVKRMEAVPVADAAAAADAAQLPTVYLAECSYDRREAREALRAELRLRGHTVLPDAPLPRDETACVAEIERLLGRCELAVHLVGTQYGAVPDGPSCKSVTVLQNEAAVRQSRDRQLPRLIWLPAGTGSADDQQQAFIAALHGDGDSQFGADLITADLQAVKGALQAALARIQHRQCVQAAADSTPDAAQRGPFVYLICDERDRRATLPLRRQLKAAGIDVAIPVFEGDAATVRQTNDEQLAQCDTVLVFYGAGDEAWKRTVDSELRKLKGNRSRPLALPSRCVIAEPASDDKRDLLELETDAINALDDQPEPAVEAFVAALRQAVGPGLP